MRGYAMLQIGKTGWLEKEKPVCGPLDAILRPLALSPCTSDIHTVYEGAIGERKDMILGHEAVGEVVEVGNLVKDFRPGDRVVVAAITPDWSKRESQSGFPMHSGGMLSGWKFSNFKMVYSVNIFMSMMPTATWPIFRSLSTRPMLSCYVTWSPPDFMEQNWPKSNSAIRSALSESALWD